MKIPTPINAAEAIIEPFWDPHLTGLKHWTVDDGAAHGLRVKQFWCSAQFEWARRPAAGPALRMTRTFDLDCSAYDRLVVSLCAPVGATLKLIARTENGERTWVSDPSQGRRHEWAMPIEGLARLLGLTMELRVEVEGPGAGWFNWIGLQHTTWLPRHLAQWQGYDDRWPIHLRPVSTALAFRPTHGLIATAEEIEAVRARHAAFVKEHGESPFTRAASELAAAAPESQIREHLVLWKDHFFIRERERDVVLGGNGPRAAFAGVLLKDPVLLRLGARYAMAMGMSRTWEMGAICEFPGGLFEQRSFGHATAAHEIGQTLDLAGECFTEVGRDYLWRLLAERGLGNITFNTWKWEYIFDCNQLAWFSPGRMLALAVLKTRWPRVQPYLEIAHRELIESLERTILPDGGYVEGPTYFRCVGHSAGLALHYYARSTGRTLPEVIPAAMRRCAGYGALIASTDDARDVIPLCDAGPRGEMDTLATMATALPDSAWVGLYRKAVARLGGMPDTPHACLLDPTVPALGPDLPVFLHLPELRCLASVRRLGGERVKILIPGNRAGAGHAHQDKGSFVLEFAGDTFAMDPGICQYSHPLVTLFKAAERHNMLVPTGTDAKPQPVNPIPADVPPSGSGDATAFHAEVDATPGWEGFYRRWVRRWESSAPDTLVIRDEYELAAGDGVEFFWQTQLEPHVEGRRVRLRSKRGEAIVEGPADCKVRVDDLSSDQLAPHYRIAFVRAGRTGVCEVRVRLAQV